MSNDRIQITVGQTGAAEAAAALQGVERATAGVTTAAQRSAEGTNAAAEGAKRLARENKDGAEKQADFSRKAQGSTQVLEGLKMASAGGASAIFGLGKALEGLLTVVGLGGPWGKALVVATGLVSSLNVALDLLRDSSQKTADSAESDGDRVKRAWDEASAALSKRREETFSEQIDAIKRRADEATESANRLMAARERMANAEMGAELEAISANSAYTPEERRVLELKVRQRYAREAEDRRFGAIDEPVNSARQAEERFRATLEDRQGMVDRTARTIADQDAQRRNAVTNRDAAYGEIQASAALGGPMSPEVLQLYNDSKDTLARMDTPEANRDRGRLEEQLKQQQAALETAQQQLAAAERARRQAEELAATERKVQTREREANERARQSSMGAAESARASRVAVGQATPDDPLQPSELDVISQRRSKRAADFGIGLAERTIEGAERGPATVGNRAIADAAGALRDSMSRLSDGATAGEIVAALKDLTELFRKTGDSDTRAELQKLGAELKRLQMQMATARNR